MKTSCATCPGKLLQAHRRACRGQVFAAVLCLGLCAIARGQPAFQYAPVTNGILGAALSINFAALTANPTVAGTTVNALRLWDSSGLTFMDLSLQLFGSAAWPSPPLINQGALQTGFFSANISPTFFPVLLGGQVGMTAQLTDTADGVFALDTIQLSITTSTGTILSYYGSPADGFGIGLAPGGNLPGPLPGSLGFTGTGFDEAISGKFISAIPEPGTTGLLAMGLGLLFFLTRKKFFRAAQNPKRMIGKKKIAALVFSLSLLGMMSESVALASPMTRAQAAAVVLNPSNGLIIDTNLMNVWSPYVDFGSGSFYEGLLPAGSLVEPAEYGWNPYPGSSMPVLNASYFFWLDTLPDGDFEHSVYFVLVDANNPAPTVGNGGIQVIAEGWWPLITPNGGPQADYFHTSAQVESAAPAGPLNPQGLIAGSTLQPGEISFASFQGTDNSASPEIIVTAFANPATSNSCAIVGFGATDKPTFRNSARLMEKDLVNHYGVPTNRIVRAGGTNAFNLADLATAITMICTSQPPCDKVFIRLASHGVIGGLVGRSGVISAANLCNQFKKVSDKGVPVCALINACYSGSLLQPNNWNLPAGSTVITATGSNTVGHSWCYFDGNTRFTNQVFTYAFSKCLNANPTNTMNGRRLDRNGDGFVSDDEAFAWVTNVMPCYVMCNNTNIMRYPAGKTNTGGVVTTPQIRTIGTDPRMINLNVCNGTGTNKTDFHMIFQGNVTNGVARAWRSTVDDRVMLTNVWAQGRTNTMITYDSNRNETMVCWTNGASPVLTNQYIHFGYFPPRGSTLRPRRQWWTPTTNPPPALPAQRDRVPTPRPKILWDTNTAFVSVQVLNDSTNDGGWGTTLLVTNRVYYSRDLIPLQNLNLGNAAVTNLPLVYANDGTVPVDGAMEFSLALPASPGDPNPTAVLVTTASWSVNPMVAVSVQALPCNIFRGLTAATSPDQIHLYGPSPNSFPANTTQTLTAMVENSFIGMEGATVNYSALLGAIQFTSGAIGGGGTTSSVLTDPSGAATVDFIVTAAGPALIQASVNGMNAYQFLQVLAPAPILGGGVSIACTADGMCLSFAGEPNQAYDIQRSTDLVNWHTIATVTASAVGEIKFQDASPPAESGFYRAVPR